jgi:xanthine dehydrogenase accessory factor
MLILIRGAGDLATGIALRLHRAGFQVVMTEIPRPTSIRRTVCFSQAVRLGSYQVEDVTADHAASPKEVPSILKRGHIPVLVDPEAACLPSLRPDALVDAILAKRNLGTRLDDAPVVIACGPGFSAGVDCHAVVETMRGHYLGRVILDGPAIANTNIPGRIGGFTGERVLRAPDDGVFHLLRDIGETVKSGDAVGEVNGLLMRCTIDGVLRGVLADQTPVSKGMKAGDVDPRGDADYCRFVSDKATAIGGGVLEAILRLTGAMEKLTSQE